MIAKTGVTEYCNCDWERNSAMLFCGETTGGSVVYRIKLIDTLMLNGISIQLKSHVRCK